MTHFVFHIVFSVVFVICIIDNVITATAIPLTSIVMMADQNYT